VALRFVGAGLSAIAMAGAGVGIGTIFGAFMLSFTKQP